MNKIIDNSQLTALGTEWQTLTEQSTTIRERKDVIRPMIEPYFNTVLLLINKEFEELKIPYHFRSKQYAGINPLSGALLFDLYPDAKGGWQEEDPAFGGVDYGRAEELTKLVNDTKVVQEFQTAFPNIVICVTASQLTHFSSEEVYKDKVPKSIAELMA